MEVLEKENRRGGDTSIKIDIPISGLEEREKGAVEVVVRTPTGGQLSFSSAVNSNLNNGLREISAMLDLGPRHAEGEYMITHISTKEDYSSAVDVYRGLSLVEGGQRTHEARLLERGIRATLKVSPPPSGA